MRSRGLLQDAAAARLHDHVGWVGHGRADLDETARQVFHAAAENERLLFLPRDGSPGAIGEEFAADLASGRLGVLAGDDVYEPLLTGGAEVHAEQLRRFDDVIDDALEQGYVGVRVVADNTATLGGDDASVARWLAWEQLADRWQARRPLTGNCWFDRDQLRPDLLTAALCRHPVTVAVESPWRIGYEVDAHGELLVSLAGSVDAFDVAELMTALRTCRELDDHVDLSLTGTAFLHHSVPFAVSGLAEHAGGMRVVSQSSTVARLLSVLPPLAGFAA